MEQNSMISVIVAYADPDKQQELTLLVPENSTIEQVIQLSGILTHFPNINLSQQQVGIYGKLKTLTDKVEAGDRVEIYRPLLIDPKEARRAKAKKIAKEARRLVQQRNEAKK